MSMDNVTITRNYTGNGTGGGIYFTSDDGSDSLSVSSSTIKHNVSEYGGGLHVNYSGLILNDVIIDSNHAIYGGALYVTNNTSSAPI